MNFFMPRSGRMMSSSRRVPVGQRVVVPVRRRDLADEAVDHLRSSIVVSSLTTLTSVTVTSPFTIVLRERELHLLVAVHAVEAARVALRRVARAARRQQVVER